MAKIPIILEPGRADGKLIKTKSVYDDNQEKFLSDKIKEIDDNHNNLKDEVSTLTEVVNNNESDIETKLKTEKTRATNAENNLRETINNITNINEHASTAELITVNTLPNSTVSNVQQALTELLKNATFAGVATPTTNPGTPDGPVFYIASTSGIYSNFGGKDIYYENTILKWNGSYWEVIALNVVTKEYITDELSRVPAISDNSDTNLDISDDKGNVIMRLKDGHIKTKNFDSKTINHITNEKEVDYLSGINFRARIPILKNKDNTYYTTYDFEKNRIAGNGKTIYVDAEKGSDINNGLSNKQAKKTITAALNLSPNTVILLPGTYIAGIHFTNNAIISDVNLIGIGSVIIDANAGKPFCITGNIFCKNITFTNGNLGSLHTYITDTASICTYIKCKFLNSIVDNQNIGSAQSLGGLRIQGGTHFLYKCEASHNGYDGFNYHAAPDNSSVSPHVVEVECKGFFNGEDNSYESDNGSTSHDGAKVVRLNCEFGSCHGGIVADVHANTISYNFGCIAFSSLVTEGEYSANFFAATGAEMHLYSCKSNGSIYDISCFNGAKVFTDNVFINNYSVGGTIIKK